MFLSDIEIQFQYRNQQFIKQHSNNRCNNPSISLYNLFLIFLIKINPYPLNLKNINFIQKILNPKILISLHRYKFLQHGQNNIFILFT